jgi:hypothetical protein
VERVEDIGKGGILPAKTAASEITDLPQNMEGRGPTLKAYTYLKEFEAGLHLKITAEIATLHFLFCPSNAGTYFSGSC